MFIVVFYFFYLDLFRKIRDNKEFKIIVFEDVLMGFFNCCMFDEKILFEIVVCVDNDMLIFIFIVDVDYFKKYNDNYGYLEGD